MGFDEKKQQTKYFAIVHRYIVVVVVVVVILAHLVKFFSILGVDFLMDPHLYALILRRLRRARLSCGTTQQEAPLV